MPYRGCDLAAAVRVFLAGFLAVFFATGLAAVEAAAVRAVVLAESAFVSHAVNSSSRHRNIIPG